MQRLPSPVSLACIVAFFFLLGFFVYGSSLENSFVSWDDNLLILENSNIHALNAQTLYKIFTSYDPELYIPMTLLSYQIEFMIAGLHPYIFHLTNLLLHIANSVLVSWFLYHLLQKGWLALALGAVFLVHPLNTEAVAWASARKDVLATFFFLTSLLSFQRYSEIKSRRIYSASLLLFLCGVLSKVMVVTLPVIFILSEVLMGKRITRKSLQEKVPFFLISLIFGIIAIFGKTTVLVSSSVGEKVLIASKATIFYIGKFLVPTNLSVMYPYSKPITLYSADFFIPVILIIFMCSALWCVRRYRILLFGGLFYCLTLLSSFTNFVKGGEIYFASDRYAYIPMIGLLLIVGFLAKHWMDLPSNRHAFRSRQIIIACLSCFIILMSGYASFLQAQTWKNSTALYTEVLEVYPDAWVARNNLGLELLALKRYDDALVQLDQAIVLRPMDPRTKANRAAVLVAQGSLDQALAEFQKALLIDKELPDALYGIGNVYQKNGDFQKAAEQYRITLQIDPTYANALNNLAAVNILLKDWDGAIDALKKVSP